MDKRGGTNEYQSVSGGKTILTEAAAEQDNCLIRDVHRPQLVYARPLSPELAIIVPTYNEIANIPLMVAALARALIGIRWEVIFVDDHSPDGTADRVRELAMQDPRIRVVHRFGRRGLATACVEGILATSAPCVAVIDADMQHDEVLLTEMYSEIRKGAVDLVVGSRYVTGGGIGEWGSNRIAMSHLATRLSSWLTPTKMTDPMSGFFMISRQAFMAALPNLSSLGFKVLLDITTSSPAPLRVAELPYTFRVRQHGVSKLDSIVVWEFLQLMLEKTVGHIVPARFVSFALIGGAGAFVHFLVLFALLQTLPHLNGSTREMDWFAIAQGTAALVATSTNFILNNLLTYSDRRLSGQRLFWGWLTFSLVCGVGVLANVGVARWLFQRQHYVFVAALAGIAVTSVWNYAMSSVFTWRGRR